MQLLPKFIIILAIIITAYATPCSKLDIKETTLDSAVTQVHWLPRPDDHIVFIRTQNGVVYRSVDGGSTWTNELRRMNTSNTDGSNGVYKMESPSIDSSVVFFIGNSATSWITSNGGASYSTVGVDLDLYSVKFHPIITTSILGLSKTPQCRSTTAQGDCLQDLYISKDLGMSWNRAMTYVFEFEWASDGVWVVSSTQKSGDMRQKSRDDAELVLYSEYSAQKTVIMPPVIGITTNKQFLFVLQGDAILLVSPDDGKSFNRAILPQLVVLKKNRFTILHSSGGSVVLQVSNSEDRGDVYISDSTGSKFAISLSNVVIQSDYEGGPLHTQFVRLKGLPGTYLANVEEKGEIVTRITYNHGATWSHLAGSLQLHTVMNSGRLRGVGAYGPLFSTPNAVGLMIGSGNTGSSLTASAASFLTRDGGHEWTKVFDASVVSGIGDMGAMMVVTRQDTTSVFDYSLDEGQSWQECVMTTSPVSVRSIFSEPNSMGRCFLIVAGDGVIVHVNMSSVHERVCQQSDYEWWHPHGTGHCLMGEHMTYQRRKRDSACLVHLDVNQCAGSTPCPCTADDYECDVCYSKVNMASECLWNSDLCANAPELACNDTMIQSFGYRKIPGDKCIGFVNGLEPHIITCHDPAWLWLLLIPVTLVSLIGMYKVGVIDPMCWLGPYRARRGRRRRRGGWSDEWWGTIFGLFEGGRPYRFRRIEHSDDEDDMEMNEMGAHRRNV